MSIMAKTPSGYKKIGSAYLGERPVDKVFNANGDVIYALQRELTGVPPLLFKGKEQSELLNYRIYGDTVDGNSVGDLVESGEHAGEYKVPVTVEGKNLFDINNLEDHYDISSETGLPVRNSAYSYLRCAITTPINVSAGDYYLTFNKNIAGEIGFIVSVFENNTLISRTPGYYSGARIRISSGNNIYIGFYNQNVAVAIHSSDISNIMLNSGSTALPYEPYHAPVTTPIYLPEQIRMVGDEAEYIDYAEQKQHRVRKNLLPNTATSQENNGVTFTVNSDGSVTCNGTSTSQYYSLFRIPCYLVAGNYTISGCPAGGSSRKYRADIRISPNGGMVGVVADIGAGATVPIDESGWYDYTIRIQGSYTVDDVTFKPMIRKADIEDDTYEPYIENTDLDVTLPALPTIMGTNTLSVDTEVQPSRMDIKGRIKSLT